MGNGAVGPVRWRGAFVLAALLVTGPAGCGSLTKQFEYEEDVTLSLDGRATIYVNASLAALTALRGAALDLKPNARFDAAPVRAFFTSAGTRVGRVSSYRRHGRRYAYVRIDVEDIRKLSAAPPFAWSTYALDRSVTEVVYRQAVAASANTDVGNVGWTGRELVAFRLHLPAKVIFHNAPSRKVERGNILEWEQTLTHRRAGVPLAIEVRMEPTSILYRTLWLFAISGLLAVLALGAIIWWVVRKA